MQAGHDVAVQYRELLQLVLHNLSRPSSATQQNLSNISRKIAQCVTDLAAAAELLKDDDWVDPSDPTFIAENELLGAAKSIENAAKKLASLKPRREIKGKVGRLFCCLLSPLLPCTSLHITSVVAPKSTA
jgi:talin